MHDISTHQKRPALRPWHLAGLLLVMFLYITTGPSFGQESPLIEQLKDHPATLKTQSLQVAVLLQAIGRQAGVNIYVDDKIDDTINIDMENLSLYQIFQLVMEAKHLRYNQKGDIVFVERESDYRTGQKDFSSENLCTRFGNAGGHLEKLRKFLSQEGSITEANRGNCLIVRDRKENLERVKQILEELDQPIPQVHIEARIVSITQEAKRQLGIRWGYDNLSTRNPLTATSDLSVAGTSNLAIGFIRDNLNLSVDLQALQQDDKLQILSAPQILVLDGQEAEIKQGKEIPYVVQSGDTINTSFREANLSLKVTPRVIRDNYIVLDVLVTNDSVDQSSSGGEPLINKQSITTNLFLENDATVVIGGILLHTEDDQRGSVPGISKIPLLGNLFKNSEKSNDHQELVVFITPSIVKMLPLRAEARPDAGGAGAVEPGPAVTSREPADPPASE